MSNITEIKHRINGIRDTKKMTNAMYLIASNKVRKAKASLERTRPYLKSKGAESAAISSSPRTRGLPARITKTL